MYSTVLDVLIKILESLLTLDLIKNINHLLFFSTPSDKIVVDISGLSWG